jgi:hypothetical protein
VLSHGCQKLVQALSHQFPELRQTIKRRDVEKPLQWLREKRNSLEIKNEIILAQDRNILPKYGIMPGCYPNFMGKKVFP